MTQVIIFCQTYGVLILGAMLLVLLVSVCVLIHKTTVIRKRMDRIANEVKKYIGYVLASEDEKDAQEAEMKKREEKAAAKRHREEQQNQVISAVLEEIFP